MDEGAFDVFGAPVQMKKNRPGMILTVLSQSEDAGKLAQLIFSETTTLGVRQRDEYRQTLARRWENVAPMGRGAHQDCEHERYDDELRPRVRGLPQNCCRTSRAS